MARRTVGLKRLPNAATVSRTLSGIDNTAMKELRRLSRSLMHERLRKHAPTGLTLGFDGLMFGTTRMAEDTAVGDSKKAKRQGSDDPLCYTVAPGGQALDV